VLASDRTFSFWMSHVGLHRRNHRLIDLLANLWRIRNAPCSSSNIIWTWSWLSQGDPCARRGKRFVHGRPDEIKENPRIIEAFSVPRCPGCRQRTHATDLEAVAVSYGKKRSWMRSRWRSPTGSRGLVETMVREDTSSSRSLGHRVEREASSLKLDITREPPHASAPRYRLLSRRGSLPLPDVDENLEVAAHMEKDERKTKQKWKRFLSFPAWRRAGTERGRAERWRAADALARISLMLSPKLFLIDEPSGACLLCM